MRNARLDDYQLKSWSEFYRPLSQWYGEACFKGCTISVAKTIQTVVCYFWGCLMCRAHNNSRSRKNGKTDYYYVRIWRFYQSVAWNIKGVELFRAFEWNYFRHSLTTLCYINYDKFRCEIIFNIPNMLSWWGVSLREAFNWKILNPIYTNYVIKI